MRVRWEERNGAWEPARPPGNARIAGDLDRLRAFLTDCGLPAGLRALSGELRAGRGRTALAAVATSPQFPEAVDAGFEKPLPPPRRGRPRHAEAAGRGDDRGFVGAGRHDRRPLSKSAGRFTAAGQPGRLGPLSGVRTRSAFGFDSGTFGSELRKTADYPLSLEA